MIIMLCWTRTMKVPSLISVPYILLILELVLTYTSKATNRNNNNNDGVNGE